MAIDAIRSQRNKASDKGPIWKWEGLMAGGASELDVYFIELKTAVRLVIETSGREFSFGGGVTALAIGRVIGLELPQVHVGMTVRTTRAGRRAKAESIGNQFRGG